jgi:hypothetical protein
LVATRTCVAALDIPGVLPRTKRFLRRSFVRVGRLRVAGQFLTATEPFTVEIPARYAIVSEKGPGAGSLDGTPYRGARFLPRGHHEFRPEPGEGRLALVWAQAVERGFSPFSGEAVLAELVP